MPEEKETVLGCIQAANKAMKMLKEFDMKKSCLQLVTIDVDRDTLFEPYVSGAVPVIDYEHALRYIREEIFDSDDYEESMSERYEFYCKLVLYVIDDTGEAEENMEYICDSFGEVQYLNNKRNHSRIDCLANGEQNFIEYFSSCGLKNWVTPFKNGDILYINCRPYFPPAYCLVYYTPPEVFNDCRGLRCYYPTFFGFIAEETFKHGCFLPANFSYYDQCCMNPLFRAEIYEGDLPEEYKLLEDISKQLKENPIFGEKLNMLTPDFCKDYMMASTYVPIAKNGDRTKDRIAIIDGMTKEKLAEIIEIAKDDCIKK